MLWLRLSFAALLEDAGDGVLRVAAATGGASFFDLRPPDDPDALDAWRAAASVCREGPARGRVSILLLRGRDGTLGPQFEAFAPHE